MAKKRNSSAGLLLDLINRFDQFKEDNREDIDRHEIILNGADGVSGVVKDVNTLKDTHVKCNIADLNDKVNKGIGMLIVVSIIMPILLTLALTAYFNYYFPSRNVEVKDPVKQEISILPVPEKNTKFAVK